MKRGSVLVALIVVVAVSSLVLLAQFNSRAGPPAGASTTTSTAIAFSTQQGSMSSSGSSASTSLTQQESTSSSSSRTALSALITIGQAYKALFVAPGVTMNYTIKISQLDTTASPVNLTMSASSPIPGVTVATNPKDFTLAGTQEFAILAISVAPVVNSSTIPVEVIASSANSATNSTFDFVLNKNLIVVTPYAEVVPPTLHVSAGQSVTWLNLMGTQAGDPVVVNVALLDGSGASPSMFLNDLWSHTFDKPGTYQYQVTVTGTPPASGVVIVE